jgi:hypothetical protein
MGRLLQGGLLYETRGLQAQVQPPSHGQARQHSSWHFLLSLTQRDSKLTRAHSDVGFICIK